MVGEAGPRRVLLLTAEMGEGHNAAARALGRTAEELWPGVELRFLDAIRQMGPGMSWAAQATYRFALTRTPWVYQFFYDALWRHPWFAGVNKRLIAAWCGRCLRRRVRRYRPDLVACTHPFGAAGMDWLRHSGGYAAPTVLFVTDFAPHPFWVYPRIDLHLVLHELGAAQVRRLGGDRVRVAALPVAPAFHPRDRHAERRRLGLAHQDQDAFVALVTGGAWGVGTLEDAVRVLLRDGGQVQVVAVCGRNEELRIRLEALGAPLERLVVLGFVDTMPALLAACDVVVTNAGGLTALEAFASARPVVLFDPIAGHGRANAALMERAGLAVVCHGTAELRATIAELAAGGVLAARLRETARLVAGRDLADDVRLLASTALPVPFGTPRRASDLPVPFGTPRRASAFSFPFGTPRRAPEPPREPRRPPLRVAVRLAVAMLLAVLVVSWGSYVAGTRLAPAARGAPAPSGAVAITLAGSLPPAVLRAVARAAGEAGVPLTFFVEGADAAADAALLASLERQGLEVEAGTWRAGRDDQLRPGRVYAEFSRTLDAVTRADRHRPRYVAEPDGQFSLVAVATTGDLHLRRVVFGWRTTVPPRVDSLPPLAPGQIVELLVLPTASAVQVRATVLTVAAAARGRGLRLATVDAIDRAGRAPAPDRRAADTLRAEVAVA